MILDFIKREGELIQDYGERPFKNEHSARLITPPKKFLRVARTKGSGRGKIQGVKIPSTISVIWYIIKRGKEEIPRAQALRFPTKNWTSKEARKWLKDNKIKHILFEKASSEKRENQEDFDTMKNLGIAVRSINVEPRSVNEEDRSVDVILTTETRVKVMDLERWEVVDEILLSDGIQHANQIPFLDSHQHRSVKNQLGSVRNIKTSGKKTTGTVFFGTKQEADDAFTMVKEGHLTDVSIGYNRLKSVFIEKGSIGKVNGREFKGPVRITSVTEIKELSGTPLGADSIAKFRSAINCKDKTEHETNA